MILQDLIHHLETSTGHSAKKSGSGYIACCPSHDDTNPSLSISEGGDGKILLNCFAGCSLEDICQSLGIKQTDLFPETSRGGWDAPRKKTVYRYQDEDGCTLFSKVRIEPGFKGSSKSFYCERVDENGNAVKSLNGCRKVLYRLPELLKAITESKTIFLVEGEKDTEKLIEYGLAATTAPESLKWIREFSETLIGTDVVILYDMDKTGYERREMLCGQLFGIVNRLRVVDLPGLEYQESHGKDVSDWLAKGHTTAELLELVSRTPDFAPTQKDSGSVPGMAEKSSIFSPVNDGVFLPESPVKTSLNAESSPEKASAEFPTRQDSCIRAVSLEDFLKVELPKREMLLFPFLPTQGLCLLYAKRGVGKTHVALGIAYAIATGGTFLRWYAPAAKKVLYIDGEMPAAAMQERLRRISIGGSLQPPDPSFFRLVTPDLQELPMPNLSTNQGREAIEALVQDSDLIIIDNISTLFRSGDENEAESWQPVQDWALSLRRRGKSVLFVHHAAKAGQQRGTSKREDILDTVITLKPPPNHRADQGACFDVSFEKTRNFSGEDAAPFQVALKVKEDGSWLWEVSDASLDDELAKVVTFHQEGLTIEETIQRTALTKSQVETRLKKAKERGLI